MHRLAFYWEYVWTWPSTYGTFVIISFPVGVFFMFLYFGIDFLWFLKPLPSFVLRIVETLANCRFRLEILKEWIFLRFSLYLVRANYKTQIRQKILSQKSYHLQFLNWFPNLVYLCVHHCYYCNSCHHVPTCYFHPCLPGQKPCWLRAWVENLSKMIQI